MITVLVVDDNPDQTQLMCHMLSYLGFHCIVAHSGREAIQLAKQHLPDLIIMDWIMPSESLTGMDTLQAIRSMPVTTHIPIIACSAVDDLSRALDAGCLDSMLKPFGMGVLRQTLSPFMT